ncbi:hypothetical protein SEA_NANOSMITE_46 [Mycobacterium phage Nanosmite]|nr:hypothetical protein SEA_NANOSMITE_46 [Mycobacterium phage Nanosmite]
MAQTLEQELELAEQRLAAAVSAVDTIKAEIKERDADPYPVGTVLRSTSGSYPFILYKLEMIGKDDRYEGSPAIASPCWVSVFEDFSGGVHETLHEAKETHPRANFVVAYRPSDAPF